MVGRSVHDDTYDCAPLAIQTRVIDTGITLLVRVKILYARNWQSSSLTGNHGMSIDSV